MKYGTMTRSETIVLGPLGDYLLVASLTTTDNGNARDGEMLFCLRMFAFVYGRDRTVRKRRSMLAGSHDGSIIALVIN